MCFCRRFPLVNQIVVDHLRPPTSASLPNSPEPGSRHPQQACPSGATAPRHSEGRPGPSDHRQWMARASPGMMEQSRPPGDMHSASLSRCGRLGRAVPVSSQAERKQQKMAHGLPRESPFRQICAGTSSSIPKVAPLVCTCGQVPIPNVPTVIPPKHSVPRQCQAPRHPAILCA